MPQTRSTRAPFSPDRGRDQASVHWPMLVGVPKEIKADEGRVALTPAGADALSRRGHQVIVECGAGVKSGIPDAAFTAAGAKIAANAADVWSKAEMIVKVKEPLASEWPMIRSG